MPTHALVVFVPFRAGLREIVRATAIKVTKLCVIDKDKRWHAAITSPHFVATVSCYCNTTVKRALILFISARAQVGTISGIWPLVRRTQNTARSLIFRQYRPRKCRGKVKAPVDPYVTMFPTFSGSGTLRGAGLLIAVHQTVCPLLDGCYGAPHVLPVPDEFASGACHRQRNRETFPKVGMSSNRIRPDTCAGFVLCFSAGRRL